MSKNKKNKKPPPTLRSDEEAERFVEQANLTEYDLSGGRELRFEFEHKTARVNKRPPQKQLDTLKAEAKSAAKHKKRALKVKLVTVYTTVYYCFEGW